MNIFELVGSLTLDGTDKVNQQLSGLEKNAAKVQKGLKVVGGAFTGLGVAGLAIIDKTKKINAQLGVTALNLGVSTKEMRDLTLATTNVTFPIDEVTASFDLLARAGVKDTEVLKATATAFDTLGDATGKSASEVTAKMVPAMKTFGLTAEEVAGKSDAMTYLIRNSTVSMDNFGSVVGYITPELVSMGLSMDDTIALMGIMESKGMSGEVATRAFRTAITRATKEQIPLNEALGITSEEMAEYQEKLDGATGLTEEYAEEANKQYTLMDKLKQKWSELTLGASGFLEPLEPVLSGMTALGPLMIGLSTSAGTAAVKWGLHTVALVAHKVAMLASAIAIKVVTAAQWLWNAAMAANPIGIIIIAIGALIAAGVLLWKNWDKVVAFFKDAWDKMKEVMNSAKEFFIDIWDKIVGIFTEHWDKILAILFPAIGLPILIARNWDKIVEVISGIWNRVVESVGGILGNLKNIIMDFGENALDWLTEKFESVVRPIKETWEWIRNLIGRSPGVIMLAEEVMDLEREIGNLTIKGFDALIKRLQTSIMFVIALTDRAIELTKGFVDLSLTIEAAIEDLDWFDQALQMVDQALQVVDRALQTVSATIDRLKTEISEYIDLLEAIPTEITTTITTVYQTVGGGGGGGVGEGGGGAGGQPFVGVQRGGIAMREMLARVGEQAPRVPEALIPLSRESLERLGFVGGGPAININIAEMNVRDDRDIDLIAEQLVTRIRLRTGVRV